MRYCAIFIILACLIGCSFVWKKPPGCRYYFPEGYVGYVVQLWYSDLPLAEKDKDGFYVLKFDSSGVLQTGDYGVACSKGTETESYFYNNNGEARRIPENYEPLFMGSVGGKNRPSNLQSTFIAYVSTIPGQRHQKLIERVAPKDATFEEIFRELFPKWKGKL